MKGPRVIPHTLSAAERRVLDAFYCGRLPAGKLSAALAVARSAPALVQAQSTAESLRLAAA
jgi:hypothetical protein